MVQKQVRGAGIKPAFTASAATGRKLVLTTHVCGSQVVTKTVAQCVEYYYTYKKHVKIGRNGTLLYGEAEPAESRSGEEDTDHKVGTPGMWWRKVIKSLHVKRLLFGCSETGAAAGGRQQEVGRVS